jgi:hypothetical protein
MGLTLYADFLLIFYVIFKPHHRINVKIKKLILESGMQHMHAKQG